MKLKTVLSTVLLAVAALLLAACGNSKADAEKARQDSIARADSIAKVKAAAEAAAEAARLDSLRQDSIAKVKDFEAKIPSFTRLYEKDNLDFLKGLGFTKKVTGKDPYAFTDDQDEYPIRKTTWTLRLDKNHYCTVVTEEGYESFGTEFTVVGAPGKWKEIKKQAQKAKSEIVEDGACYWFEIKSNTIEWGSGV